MAIADYGNNGDGHGYTIGTAVMARYNDGGHNDSRHDKRITPPKVTER